MPDFKKGQEEMETTGKMPEKSQGEPIPPEQYGTEEKFDAYLKTLPPESLGEMQDELASRIKILGGAIEISGSDRSFQYHGEADLVQKLQERLAWLVDFRKSDKGN